jgi:isoquinoline 1-oxidoreductase subunit beta
LGAARLAAPNCPGLPSGSIVDLKDIVRGAAIYGIDVVLPGMKCASIERCPVYGGRVKSFDQSDARAVPGVERVVEIPATPIPSGFKPLGGVAVIASNTWSAEQGRQRLKVEWDYGPNAAHDTTTYRAELKATARRPGRVVRNQGNVGRALQAAPHRIEADYYVPYYAHAQMEPPAAVARVSGQTCEVWAPTQDPQGAEATVCDVLGLQAMGHDRGASTTGEVTVNVTLLGGAFGRKSKHDFIAEAALLSQVTGQPMKVTWSREDDIKHDYYHAISVQHLEAGLDRSGHAIAWLHRTVYPPIQSTFQPNVTTGSSGELRQGVVDMPYAIPNVRCENGPAANHVRIGWYRSVFNIPHAFAVCSFADEMAALAGRDPLGMAASRSSCASPPGPQPIANVINRAYCQAHHKRPKSEPASTNEWTGCTIRPVLPSRVAHELSRPPIAATLLQRRRVELAFPTREAAVAYA